VSTLPHKGCSKLLQTPDKLLYLSTSQDGALNSFGQYWLRTVLNESIFGNPCDMDSLLKLYCCARIRLASRITCPSSPAFSSAGLSVACWVRGPFCSRAVLNALFTASNVMHVSCPVIPGRFSAQPGTGSWLIWDNKIKEMIHIEWSCSDISGLPVPARIHLKKFIFEGQWSRRIIKQI